MDYGTLKQLIGKGIRAYAEDGWIHPDGTNDANVQLTNGDIYGMASTILDILMRESDLLIELKVPFTESVRLSEFGR